MSRFESTTMGLSLRLSSISMDVVSRPDSRHIAQLFEKHGPRVYRRALRLLGNPEDAEEATQEIFIRVFRSVGEFREQSQLTTWLYQITTNYCLNLIRDRSRRAQLHEAHVVPMPSTSRAWTRWLGTA